MSKILAATSNALGLVTSESVLVPSAVVLSEGKQSSTGILLMDQDKAWYVTSSASDIKTTIEKISAALETISSTLTTISLSLTSIGASMTGPTTSPPPTLPTDVATITSNVVLINATKAQLDLLKGLLK